MIAAARGKKLARGAREERASGEKGERDGEGLSDFSWGLEPRSWLDARGLKGAPGTLSLSSAPELLRTREPQAASLLLSRSSASGAALLGKRPGALAQILKLENRNP